MLRWIRRFGVLAWRDRELLAVCLVALASDVVYFRLSITGVGVSQTWPLLIVQSGCIVYLGIWRGPR